MSRLLHSTVVMSLVAAPAVLLADECRYEAERSTVVDAADAASIVIVARAGSLTVRGKDGLSEVRVNARACASDEDMLDDLRLAAERRGDNVRVEALVPERGWFDWGDGYARLDMVLDVPARIAADIDDSSGGIEIRGLGPVTLHDSSGSIVVEDTLGPLAIDDSSGSITVENVSGRVDINDSSGSIEVRDVEGSVELSDSSGPILVTRASGNVTVHRDSSGSISVRDIGGDFVVRRDSSGSVHFAGVGGSVSVPR